MGWGGIGTPFPHPNFISKFIIVFPLMKKYKKKTIGTYNSMQRFFNVFPLNIGAQ